MRFRILSLRVDNNTKKLLLAKFENFAKMTPSSSEYFKVKHWLDSVMNIPFNHYITFPVCKNNPLEKIIAFVNNAKAILDRTVYGHDECKQQMLRIIAQWISNPTSHGYSIGIHGHAGVGKTSLIKSFSKARGMPFAFIGLGGASDASFLDGYSYTFEGSTYGKIVDSLIHTKCNNPIVLFDELDKISATPHGDEISNILTHITDSSQNSEFNDKYFS